MSSHADAVETEGRGGTRLPRIVGGEDEIRAPALAPQQRAREVQGVFMVFTASVARDGSLEPF